MHPASVNLWVSCGNYLGVFHVAKKKILIIGSLPPPYGGWTVRIKFTVERLKELGHTCVVLNVGKNRHDKSDDCIGIRNGFDFIWQLFKHRLMGYRVHMHANGSSHKIFLLSFAAIMISLLTFKRAILTFHAGVNQQYFPKEKSGIYLPFIFSFFFFSDKIICNYNAVKEKIAEYGVPESKIYSIPAFSVQYMKIENHPLEAGMEKFLSGHEPVILTSLCYRYEFFLDTLLKGIKLIKATCPDVGLIITGVGGYADEDVRQMALEMITDFDLKKNIYIVDGLDHNSFLLMLKRSRLYLRTPVSDGIASSVLEALSLNRPVVASENNQRPEGVITYQYDDENDLAGKVCAVINGEGVATFKPAVPVVPVIKDTLGDELDIILG